jgi:hypothetical protein
LYFAVGSEALTVLILATGKDVAVAKDNRTSQCRMRIAYPALACVAK